MVTTFRLIDVAPDTLMRVVVTAANRAHMVNQTTSVVDVRLATGLGQAQSINALKMATQLRFLNEGLNGEFAYVGDAELRNSPKSGLPQFFRAAAQQFPPYLMHVSHIARGYDEVESARQSSSVFGLGLEPERVRSIFGRWSRFSGIVDEKGHLDFAPVSMLDLGFLSRLHEALKAEISTKTFVIGELGDATAGDFYTAGLDLDAIARALVAHRSNPHDAVRQVGSLLETYLAQASIPAGGPGALLGPLVDYLSGAGQKVILKTHRNLGYGVAGFRNAADHGSDPETGRPWTVTAEAALVGTLLVLLAMKSIARYVRDGTQEI